MRRGLTRIEVLAVSNVPDSTFESIDMSIVGGGIAGILAAVKAAKKNPQNKVALFEKNSFLGGRHSPFRQPQEDASMNEAEDTGLTRSMFRGYGLQVIPREVFELLCCEVACGDEPTENKLLSFAQDLGSEVGIVAAGKEAKLKRQDLFSAAGFRAIGGAAAQKEWSIFEKITEKNLELDPYKLKDRSFAKVWDKGKKSAGSIVLAQYARLLGVADHWTSHLESLRQRIEEFSAEHVVIDLGFFEQIEAVLCSEDSPLENLKVYLSTPILRATFQQKYLSPKEQVEQLYPEGVVAYTEAMAEGTEGTEVTDTEAAGAQNAGSEAVGSEANDADPPEKPSQDSTSTKPRPAESQDPETWHFSTRKKTFSSAKLVIACSLWNTKTWLEKKYLPQQLVQIAVKSLPVSLVVSHKLATADLPEAMSDLTLIPAENVQIWKLGKQHVYCQVAVSYEQSIQAKPVVNAIRKIRRSLRKLSEVYPDLQWKDEEHVALVSNGFEVDASAEFYSEVGKVDSSVQLDHIGFAGANFGPTYAGFSNLKYSIDAIEGSPAQTD